MKEVDIPDQQNVPPLEAVCQEQEGTVGRPYAAAENVRNRINTQVTQPRPTVLPVGFND